MNAYRRPGRSGVATIGGRLRAERQRLEKSQATLGTLAGVTKGTVLSWENDVSSPNAEALAKLAEAGVDIFFVVTGTRASEPFADNMTLPIRGKLTPSELADESLITAKEGIVLFGMGRSGEAAFHGFLSPDGARALGAKLDKFGCIAARQTDAIVDEANRLLAEADAMLRAAHRHKDPEADE